MGTYLFVPHDKEIPICQGLEFQRDFLEKLQISADDEEQTKLEHLLERWRCNAPAKQNDDAEMGEEYVDAGEETADAGQ